MDKIFSAAPELIAEAAKSTLGLAALMVVVLAALGFFFFRGASEKARVGIFLALLAGTAGFIAVVVSQEPAGKGDPGPPEDTAQVADRIASLPAWHAFAPGSEQKLAAAGPAKPLDAGKGQRCTSTAYDLTNTPTEIVTFDPDSEILWAGALLQGASHARRGALQELPIRQRGPLRLSINLLSRDNARTVEDPALSTVQSAVGDLVEIASKAGHRAGSDIAYDQVSSYSLEQTALELGLSARYLGSNVRSNLSISRDAEQHNITAYFIQKMFTVSVELPQTPIDVFGSGLTPAVLDEQMSRGRIGPENPPIYVSNVVFGRMLLFTFSSEASAEDIQGALNFAYQGPGAGVSADAAKRYRRILGSAKIHVVTVGGSADDALALIRSAKLRDFFKADAPLTTARPISYTLRSLSDNAIAAVSETTRYEVVECAPPPPPPAPKGYNFVVALSDIDDDVYMYVNGKRVAYQDRKKGKSTRVTLDRDLGRGDNRLRIRLGNYGCFRWKLSMRIIVDGSTLITRGDEGNAGPWPTGCGWQLDWCYTVNREKGTVKASGLRGGRCR